MSAARRSTEDPPSLAGLDAVPWHAIRHSYGAATDTPGNLRNLLASDASTREHALEDLQDSICHQDYQISEGSLAAIPFLVDLLAYRRLPQRSDVMQLLASIAQGNGWFQGAGEFDFVQRVHGQGRIARMVAKEAELQTRIAAAIGRELATIATWLDDDDAANRSACLRLLGAIREQTPETQAALQHNFARSPDPRQRAAVLNILAIQCELEPGGADLLRTAAQQGATHLERLAATVGLLVQHAPLPPASLEVLHRACVSPHGQLLSEFEQLPTAPGRDWIYHALRSDPESCRAVLATVLDESATDPSLSSDRGRCILSMAANAEAPWFRADTLSDIQRRAIETVGAAAFGGPLFEAVPHRTTTRAVDVLRAVELPDELEELRRFLSDPGFTKAPASSARRWWQFWRRRSRPSG